MSGEEWGIFWHTLRQVPTSMFIIFWVLCGIRIHVFTFVLLEPQSSLFGLSSNNTIYKLLNSFSKIDDWIRTNDTGHLNDNISFPCSTNWATPILVPLPYSIPITLDTTYYILLNIESFKYLFSLSTDSRFLNTLSLLYLNSSIFFNYNFYVNFSEIFLNNFGFDVRFELTNSRSTFYSLIQLALSDHI